MIFEYRTASKIAFFLYSIQSAEPATLLGFQMTVLLQKLLGMGLVLRNPHHPGEVSFSTYSLFCFIYLYMAVNSISFVIHTVINSIINGYFL